MPVSSGPLRTWSGGTGGRLAPCTTWQAWQPCSKKSCRPPCTSPGCSANCQPGGTPPASCRACILMCTGGGGWARRRAERDAASDATATQPRRAHAVAARSVSASGAFDHNATPRTPNVAALGARLRAAGRKKAAHEALLDAAQLSRRRSVHDRERLLRHRGGVPRHALSRHPGPALDLPDRAARAAGRSCSTCSTAASRAGGTAPRRWGASSTRWPT